MNFVKIEDVKKREAQNVFTDVTKKLETLFNDRLSRATVSTNY